MANKSAKWTLGLAVTLALAGCPAVDRTAADKTAADTPPAAVKSPEMKPADMQPSGMQPAETRPMADGQPYVGWYMERAGQGMFQACGESRQLPVSGSEELRAKAREFGLEQNTPVYVRLMGTSSASGDMLKISKVEQFGSPTPVRDCGMTGVVIPDPGN